VERSYRKDDREAGRAASVSPELHFVSPAGRALLLSGKRLEGSNIRPARSRCAQMDIRSVGLHNACALNMKRTEPKWFDLPVMMRLTLSAPHHALQNLGKCDLTRPHNFMIMPKISPFGYPAGVNPANPNLRLITQLASERKDWIKSKCIKIHDRDSPTYKLKFDDTDDGISTNVR
jgi:hypothetical protein